MLGTVLIVLLVLFLVALSQRGITAVPGLFSQRRTGFDTGCRCRLAAARPDLVAATTPKPCCQCQRSGLTVNFARSKDKSVLNCLAALSNHATRPKGDTYALDNLRDSADSVASGFQFPHSGQSHPPVVGHRRSGFGLQPDQWPPHRLILGRISPSPVGPQNSVE